MPPRLFAHGGGGWIRTTEARASDLQSDPFGHSGTPPKGATLSLWAAPLSTIDPNKIIDLRRFRTIFPPQDVFLDLTHRITRQFLDKEYAFRHLKAGNPGLHCVTNLALRHASING